jgi:hypothetical protein
MGLWLKCPKCQASNPLTLKACASCGASLENLSAKNRVYVLTPAGAPPPAPAAAAQAIEPKTQPTKPSKPTPAKKAEAAPSGSRAWESEGPPPKKAKGPKAVKKKKEK